VVPRPVPARTTKDPRTSFDSATSLSGGLKEHLIIRSAKPTLSVNA
jgi:hypothetical protein